MWRVAVWSRDVKVEWADFERALTEVQAGNGALRILRQYLHFCTSKASKLSTACNRALTEGQAGNGALHSVLTLLLLYWYKSTDADA